MLKQNRNNDNDIDNVNFVDLRKKSARNKSNTGMK